MRTLRPILLTVAAVALLPFGVARADVLECTVDPGLDTAYIAPKIRIEYDAYRTARVSDSVIVSTDLRFVEGSVEKETDAMIRFFWVVKDVKLNATDLVTWNNNRTTLIVRLSVNRADGSAVLAVQIALFSRTLRATGQCQNVD